MKLFTSKGRLFLIVLVTTIIVIGVATYIVFKVVQPKTTPPTDTSQTSTKEDQLKQAEDTATKAHTAFSEGNYNNAISGFDAAAELYTQAGENSRAAEMRDMQALAESQVAAKEQVPQPAEAPPIDVNPAPVN